MPDGQYKEYPELDVGSNGVCDSIENLLEQSKTLKLKSREFVVTLTKVVRAEQPEEGGWRWHKWGDYIGEHKPQCEYIYDEEGIDFVYVYHIYEHDNKK